MLRSLGLSFAIFVAVFVIGFVAIAATTRNDTILNQSVLDDAARVLGAAADVDAPATVEDAIESLDTVLTADPTEGQTQRLEQDRQRAKGDMQLWFTLTCLAGLASAWLWLALAERRGKSVCGPEGARSAAGMWWGGLALWGGLAIMASFYVLRSRGLLGLIGLPTLNLGLGLSLGLVLVGYYAATAFAVSRLMRPSVPLATLIIR